MIGNLIDDLARAHPVDNAPVVQLPGLTVTRAELWRDVAARRRELAAAGVAAGSTVTVQIVPSVTYLTVVLAVLQLDARAVLLHHRLSSAERASAVASFAVAASAWSPPGGPVTRFQAAAELLVTPGTAPDSAGPGAAVVQFTSGSTGQPKAVQRPQESIQAELNALGVRTGWIEAGDTVLTLNSLVHSFGLFGAVLHGLRVGAALAFPRTAQPDDLRSVIHEHRPTAITGVPAHFELLTALERGALHGVRCCVSGGQLLRPGAHAAFTGRHGIPLGQAYGLTELGLVAADFEGALAPAAGPVSAGCEVVTVDDEVVVRCASSPYLTPDEDPRWRDGWFHTHDLGRLDGDVLTIRGRLDSVVAVGGLKLDLGEVEHVIGSHPAVTGVVVTFTEGVVRGFIESGELSAADVRSWCEQRLSPHKRPRLVEVVRQLPRTPTGKLVRDSGRLVACGDDR